MYVLIIEELLLYTTYKILTAIITERLRRYTKRKEVKGEYQFGFKRIDNGRLP